MATDKGKETRKMMLYVGGAAAVVALLGGYCCLAHQMSRQRAVAGEGPGAGRENWQGKLMIPNTTSC
ncbi:hypothetical protein J4714_12605 [Staphylococcus epidermidis]|nr:hypothetical protein [Staphylococcus epidermidis]